MKILHVLYSNQYSGAENVVCQIIDMFRKEPGVEMIYCSRDGQIRQTLAERQISFVPMTDLTVTEMKRVLKELKPDVVHAHDFRASVIAAIATRGTGIRLISHLHNNPPWSRSVNKQSVAYLLAGLFCKRILLVSEAIGKEYVFNALLKKRQKVIGNPVDISSIKTKGEKTEGSDLIFVGRLSEAKNPLRFLRIVSLLKDEIPDLRAEMLGDGELRKDCEKFLMEYGLEETVKMEGFQKNPYDYIAGSKVLCMTSAWEGFGLVAVEALALGKPVVCPPVGGLTDVVAESCGQFCKTDEAFVMELKRLLTDVDYYAQKAVDARKQAEKLHNKEKYQRLLKEIYWL